MKKVCVLTDTNSGISNDKAKKLGIYIVPMPFIIDGEEYFEGVNLDHSTFYNKLTSDCQINTSQPSLGVVSSYFDKLLKDYESILYIPMSSSLSTSCKNAQMLSQESEYLDKVYVVDNHRISVTIEYCIEEALKLIELGKSAKEIKEFLEETSEDCSIYLMVDSLKYLKKGGRVTPAAALLGSLLGIKPILQIQGGKLDAFAKTRTIKGAKKIMIEQIKEDMEKRFGKDVVIHVVQAFASDEIGEFYNEAVSEFGDLVQEEIRNLSFSITCHTGPGILAITCCKKHL